MDLSYSLHIGSDKNKKKSARQSAKNNRSGTTSLANNAIQNAKGLSKVAKHNQGKYEDNPRQIEIIVGNEIYEDVKRIYKEEFEESRIAYNDKQTREDRKIKDYFKHISDNAKNDLAVEMIIELGDKEYWEGKSDDYRRKMTPVFKQQVEDLEMLVPEFKIASAIIHYDETSPHMHIVGVPIQENCKTGMSKQVGKGAVFTKNSLKQLQDKMRKLCIDSFNKEYKDNKKLKKKMKGRNIDYLVSEMGDYQRIIKQVDKQRYKIDKVDKDVKDLKGDSKEARDTLLNLKTTLTSKDKYVLTENERQELLVYIENVSNLNNEFDDIKELSVDLSGLEEEIKADKKEIKRLTDSNEAKDVKINHYKKQHEEDKEEIITLKNENFKLNNLLDDWKDKFKKVLKFLRNKIFSIDDDEREMYDIVLDDMADEGVLDQQDFNKISNDPEIEKLQDDYSI